MPLSHSDARLHKSFSDEKNCRLRRKYYESEESIDSGLSDLSFENSPTPVTRGIPKCTQTEPEHDECGAPTPRHKAELSRRPLEKQQSGDSGAILNNFTVQSIQMEAGQYVHRITEIGEKSALHPLLISVGDVILEVNDEATMKMDANALMKALRFNAVRFHMVFGRLEENGGKLNYLPRHFTIQREFSARSSYDDYFCTEPKIRVTLLSMTSWGSDSDLETDSDGDVDQRRVVARAIIQAESKTYTISQGPFYWRWTDGEVILVPGHQDDDTAYHFVMRNYLCSRATGPGNVDICAVAPWSHKELVLEPTDKNTTSMSADSVDGNLRACLNKVSALFADRCLFQFKQIRMKCALMSTTVADVCLGVVDSGTCLRCVLVPTKTPELEARVQFTRNEVSQIANGVTSTTY